MKTRTVSGKEKIRGKIFVPANNVWRLLVVFAMLALGGLAARAQATGPVLTLSTNFTVMENSTNQMNIGVSDSSISVITVGIVSQSSNPGLVSTASLALTGVGATRQLAIIPAKNQAGTAIITLTATDGLGAKSTSTINLTVTFTNYPPVFTKTIASLTRNENSGATNLAFSIFDIQTAGPSLVVTATSSNTNLVTAGNLVLSGTTTNRVLALSPATNESGSSLIQLVVTDANGYSATNAFTFTVWAVNQAPTFTLAANSLVYNENSGLVTNLTFITNVTSGPASQSGETNHFVLSYTTNFFTHPPVLDSNYDLTFAVAANTFGTNSIKFILYNSGSTTNGGKNAATNVLTLAVPFINQPPTYTLSSTLVQVPEESGLTTNKNFVTGLSVGPPAQSGQKWGFVAFTDTNSPGDAVFTNLPAVSTNGTLTFQPLIHSFGTNTITLVMTNSGGTANGAVNAFTNTFQIGVTQTLHAPVIANASNESILENSNLTATVNVWDYDQNAVVSLAATSLNPNLVLVSVSGPTAAVPPTGPGMGTNVNFSVVFTGVTNAFGSNSIRLVATANNKSTTNLLGLTVAHVNQPPAYALLARQIVVEEDSGSYTNKNIFYSFNVGPTNQNGETWKFTALTPTNAPANALFAVLPAIATNGTLTFTPLAHSYGTNTVSLIMTNSGGTANGGNNTFSNSFLICVVATNHAPVLTYTFTNSPVLENSGSIALNVNVSSYDQTTNLTFTANSLSNKVATVTSSLTNINVLTLTNSGVVFNLSNEVYTVVITPATNSSGSDPIQLVAAEGNNKTTNLLAFAVTRVNLAPTNTLATNNVFVLEESGAFSQAAFVSSLSVGAGQSGETWNFTAQTPTNAPANALFAVLPAVATNGTLTFTPLAHSFGTNLVTLVMTSSGTVTNGGTNVFTNSFTINVVATNHAPIMTGMTNQVVLENASPLTNTITLTDYDKSTNFVLVATSLSNSVASIQVVGTNYTAVTNAVVFTIATTPVTNVFGTAQLKLVGIETNGGLSTTNLMSLTVQHVNQPPSFTISTNLLLVWEESPVVTNKSLIQNIRPGPTNGNQNGLTWTFNTTVATGAATNVAFDSAPYIATNGTLYFQPLAHSYGTNLVTVVMTNNGGTTNGGVNAFTNTFYIGVMWTNHAPIIVGAVNRTASEGGSAFTAPINVWDYDLEAANFTLTATSLNTSIINAAVITTNPPVLINASNALFNVVFTPVAGGSGVATIQLVATETNAGPNNFSTTNTMTVTVNFVSQPPTFSPASNTVVVAEESSLVTLSNFLQGITSGGSTNQSGVTWSFTTTTATGTPAEAQFAVLPVIATNGNLSFQPQAHSYGNNLVTVVMTDNTQPVNGGAISATHTFNIDVTPVRHDPVIIGATSESVNESGAPAIATISVWNYDTNTMTLSGAPADSTQIGYVTATVIATNKVNASNVVFTVAFAATNTLGASLTPGSAVIQLTATELGVPAMVTTTNLTLSITPVNQAPSFTLATNLVLVPEESLQLSISNLFSSISTGLGNPLETYTITAVTDTNELATVDPDVISTNAEFAELPYVINDNDGTLIFEPLAHSFGTNKVTLTMTTTGSTANGGINTYATNFLIGVYQVPHAPTISGNGDLYVTENGGPVTATIDVFDYDLESPIYTLQAASLSNLTTVAITGLDTNSDSDALFTVVFTPDVNSNGLDQIQFVAGEGTNYSTNSLWFHIIQNNVAPSFTLSSLIVTAPEESTLVSTPGFVSSVNLGVGNDPFQTHSYAATSATGDVNNFLFAVPPAVAPNGTLTFQPLAHSYGTNIVTLTMTTSGSTANGGINTYTTNFVIAVTPVNHAPGIVASPVTLFENGVPVTSVINVWNYDSDASRLTLSVSQATNLVTTLVTLTNQWSATNVDFYVTFTPTNNNNYGVTNLTLIATDPTTLLSTTNLLTVTVQFVNQPPSFTLDNTYSNSFSPTTNYLVPVPENSGTFTAVGFATNIFIGATNQETNETFGFTTTMTTGNATNANFALPTVSTNGTLTFFAPTNSYGTNTVTLVMTNSGGTANGGLNVFTNIFQIGVTPVALPPITVASDVDALENQTGVISNSITVLDYDADTNLTLTATPLNPNLVGVTVGPPIPSTTVYNGTTVSDAVFLVTYTVSNNAYGAFPIKLVASKTDAPLTNTSFMTLNVAFVNQAPSFQIATNTFAVLEESAGVTNGFVTGISVGPSVQNGQTWGFTTTTTTSQGTNALFALAPSVDVNGVLTFRPLAHSFGTNPVTLVMTNSGGTANGGVNSYTNKFTIAVAPVPHAPVITNAPALTVNESGSPITAQISVWNYDSPSTNSLRFMAPSNSLVSDVITATNSITASNTLYTVAFACTNNSGTFPIQLVATESGSGLASTNTLTLNVQNVNQPPTFTISNAVVTVLEESAETNIPQFLTGITPGLPVSQLGQTWVFTAATTTTSATNAIFAVAPTMMNNGTLIFQPQAHSYGTNTVTVVMTTSGSTTNGGLNALTNTFQIAVTPVPHAPVIVGAVNETVGEGATPVSAPITVWDYDAGSVSSLTLTVAALSNPLASVTITGPTVSGTNALYTVRFAGTNTSGAVPVQLVATDSANGLSTTNSLTLNIGYVNQSPSFSLGAAYLSTISPTTNFMVQALEESPEVTNAGVLTAISVGPASQSGQTWSFATTTQTNSSGGIFFGASTTNAAFAVMPWIDTNGTMYFEPAAHSYGTNLVTVVMTSSGPATNGGVNTYTTNFFVGIIQTNHAPVISGLADQSIVESATPAPITFEVNVADDYDLLSDDLTLTNLPSSLATVVVGAPTWLDESNAVFEVTVTPTASISGTNLIQLVATQPAFSSGQVALLSTNSFNLAIAFVNQAPGFATTTPMVQMLEESPGVITNVLTAINVGPGNPSETWTLTAITSTNSATNAIFVVGPVAVTNGTVYIEPAPHSYGTNTVTVVMKTSGSTNNGGINTFTSSFLVGVIQTNHAPVFASLPAETFRENSAPTTNTISVWDYDQQPALLSVVTNTCMPTFANVQIIPLSTAGLVTNALFSVIVTPFTNTTGTTNIQLVATEAPDGPGQTSLHTTNTLTLNLLSVNLAPSYVTNAALVTAPEESGLVTNNSLIASLSTGPGQTNLTWGFITTTDTNSAGDAYFATLPAVSTNGTLTFKPLVHSYGTNIVTLVMTNSGGTAYGGVNAFTNTFLIGITQIAHAPGIIYPTNITLLENGSQTAIINVWDYDQTTNLAAYASSFSNALVTASITDTNVVSPSNVLFTVTYTAGVNVSGVTSVQLLATNEDHPTLITTNLQTVTVAFVDQPPTLTLFTNASSPTVLVQAPEESGVVTNTTVIYSLSTGPANQSSQTWGFTVNATGTGDPTNVFFAIQPTMATNGTLTFQPLAHSYGTNTVTLTMTNSGGTANGGLNSYTTNFLIGIAAINHAPVIANTTNQITLENTSLTNVISVWDYDQTTNFTLTVSSLTNKLAAISILSSNAVTTASNMLFTVVFTPATNVSGLAPFQLVATENGSGLSVTSTPALNILFVNQAPSYQITTNNVVNDTGITPTNAVVIAENAGLTNISNFLINPSVGPTNESGQTWAFTVICPTNAATSAVFATAPTVATNGTLSFKVANYSFGTNVATVIMTDNGGTANGGANSYTNSFVIEVQQGSYAPLITGLINKTVLENATNVTVPFTVFDPLTTNFTITCTSSNSSLVTVAVTNQTLYLNLATNASGNSVIAVTANDGSLSTTTNFLLTVTLVNQAPSFTLNVTNINVTQFGVSVTVTNAVTNILAGPVGQNTNGETVSFQVTNSNAGLFQIPPTVSASGTLSFIPGAQSGTVTVGVKAVNSGGTLNGGVNSSPYQTFTITIPANPFTNSIGEYAGLFYDTNAIGNADSGYFSVVVAADATFTGYILNAGNSNLLSGRFDITNEQATVITDSKTLNLNLNTNGAASITGTVSNSVGPWSVPLTAYLAGYSPAQPTVLAGSYNMAIPGLDGVAGPAGDSVFSVTISTNGSVTLVGALADDTTVSMVSQLSSGNLCPLYAPLYDGGIGGSLIGWLDFNGDLVHNNVTTNSLLTWFDQANYSALYTSGFTNQALPLVLFYDNTLASALSFSTGTVILAGGNLTSPITNSVSISDNTIYVNPQATNGLSLGINAATGEVLGSFVTPGGQTNLIDSVILQNTTNVVRGYFIGTTEGGSFILFGN